jgi:hypothetical protein
LLLFDYSLTILVNVHYFDTRNIFVTRKLHPSSSSIHEPINFMSQDSPNYVATIDVSWDLWNPFLWPGSRKARQPLIECEDPQDPSNIQGGKTPHLSV